MTIQNQRIGMDGIVPPIDSSLESVPSSVPGSGSDEYTIEPPRVSNVTSAVPGNTNTNTTTETETSSQSGGDTPVVYKGNNLAEIIPQIEEQIKRYKPLTEEEEKKLKRRQRTEGIINGISDAVQSVANLIFTHNYAPNMYNAQVGMSTKARERFDKAKAEREAENDKFFNYALTLGKLKDDAAKEERDWSHTIEREKIQDQRNDAADARAQAKADRDAAMAELRMELMQGKISQQEAAAEAERIEANYAEAYWQSRINKNNYRPPIRTGSSRSSKPGEYPWYDKDGNKHYAHSYEAARQDSLDNGTWNEATQQSTSQKTQQKGRRTTTTQTTTTKPAKGHSTKPQQQKTQPKKKNH